MAIVNLVKKITNSLDNIIGIIGVLIDIGKAFDTINHTILLQIFYHCVVRGIVSQWVSCYLSHRKQYVQIKGTKYNLQSILCCFPQGSNLDP